MKSFLGTVIGVLAAVGVTIGADQSYDDWLKQQKKELDQFKQDEATGGRSKTTPPPVPAPAVTPAPRPAVRVPAVDFSYTFDGAAVHLTPSRTRVAVQASATRLMGASAALRAAGYRIDPVSGRAALQRNGLTVLEVVKPPPAAARATISFREWMLAILEAIDQVLSNRAGGEPLLARPVFEQGGALLVAGDEVVVAFKEPVNVFDARARLSAIAGVDAADVTPVRDGVVRLRVAQPEGGRCFEVARLIAAREGVAYAEPNLIAVMSGPPAPVSTPPIGYNDRAFLALASGKGPALASPAPAGAAWEVLAALDAEGDLPAGWQAGALMGRATASWGPVTTRAHGGARSLHCAAVGQQAVAAPNPVPVNMGAMLRSPTYDLSAYQEVYAEFWFYAKNESKPDGYTDFGALLLFEPGQQQGVQCPMACMANTDCTQDPTADRGWRRVLFRVPPAYRKAGACFVFGYVSDGSVQTEGAYVDDVRIVACRTLPSGDAIGNDPYAGRAYELRNDGQVAGLGQPGQDLHVPAAWDLVNVAPDVVVAVIDQGVDLQHPDLALVPGFDADGTPGGGPKEEQDNHGTAVAGNIGAIRNNGKGVVGVAPGVKIMPVYWGATFAELANAIRVAVDHGARILNNSWGWANAPSAEIAAAIDYALARNRVVLFAAGNGPDRAPYVYDVMFPGCLTASREIICVGATSLTDEHKSASSSDGQHGWGSSYVGPGPDVCAPAPWSYTTDRLGAAGYNDGTDLEDADYWNGFGGTSSATPKVSGVVALMLSANPKLTPAQVKRILMDTCDDVGAPGLDDKTGAGRVNAARAVEAAKKL